MPKVGRTRSVGIELDRIVGLGELEQAARAFGRSAPAQLVADAIESMIAELVDAVVGPFGLPLPHDPQLEMEAPWACTGCGSCRGFRRRGFRPKAPQGHDRLRPGGLPLPAVGLRPLRPSLRPRAELLGLAPHHRRSDRLSELAASLMGRFGNESPWPCGHPREMKC